MRVSKDGDFYCVSHISGPTHNLLRMKVQSTPNEDFAVTVLPAIGGCARGDPLNAGETRAWVGYGVEQANAELGTRYGVVSAEVVANDSRRPGVYAELARQIVLAAHEDGAG